MTNTVRKKTKLVAGIGINDADYPVSKGAVLKGKKVAVWTCPYYKRWDSMIKRVYCEGYLGRHPSYMGCSVCKEWLTFSNFKAWMKTQPWEGEDIDLDKDILKKGNRKYCPERCVFIHSKVNTFIISEKRMSVWTGVRTNKKTGKHKAACSNPFTKKVETWGEFDTAREAHAAYKARKHQHACDIADSDWVTDERVREALRNRYK